MNDSTVTAALISAIVAILVASLSGVISYIASARTLDIERRKLEAEQARLQAQLDRQLTDRLYQLRIEHYPQAFVLTDELGKQNHPPEALPSLYTRLARDLRAWRSGVPAFVMSAESLSAYYELNKALRANLALGNKYNDQQLDRIWEARTALRKALRQDVGLLFAEEQENATR